MKASAFLLVGIFVALVTSQPFTRPAHAESPLAQTVRCLVQTILLTECPAQPSSSPSPAQPAQTETPASQPGNPSASSSSAKPVPASPSSTPAPLETPQALPSATAITSPVYPASQPFNEVAYFNTFSKYATPQASTAGFIEPTREGWKMAGVGWYWWLLMFASLAVLVWQLRVVVRARRGIL